MKRLISLFFAVIMVLSVANIPAIVSAVDFSAVTVADENLDNVEIDASSVPVIATDESSQNSEIASESSDPSESTVPSETATEPSETATENSSATEASQATESSATESVAPSESTIPSETATEPSETASESVPVTESSQPTESSSATESTAPTESTSATESTAPTETKPVVLKPKNVTDFKVSAKTTNTVTLTWNKGVNATKYYIYRAVENPKAETTFTYYLLKTIKNGNTTTFTNKNLKAGTVYKYKIVSANGAGDNELVSTGVKTVALTITSAPKKLQTKNTTTSEISMKWNAVKNAKKYYIYRKAETGKKFTHVAVVNSTSYTDKNLKSGTAYTYKVVAYRKYVKQEVFSAESLLTAVTNLKAISKIKVESATTKKIKLSWKAVYNADAYQIYRKSENASSYSLIATTNKLKYTDKKVTSGLEYTYKIRAYRTVNGKKVYGGYTSVKTPAGVVSVGNVKVSSYLNKGLFTWSAVSGVDGYDIFLQKSNGTEVLKGTTKYTSFLTSKHTASKSYIYKIKSFRKINGSKVYGAAKVAKVRIVSTAYGKSAGSNYLEVCTETQTVNMYVNGKLYISTPVVTGYANVYDTTPGFHYIISKKTPATLRGSAGNDSWNVDVKYWLGFTYDGQGFHDSTWRTSGYGGNIYKYDGSHGCVNTPIDAMSKIFSKAYTGMPVIVY